MITEDYVSFETAKLLKEKGFDEATNRYYNAQYDQIRTVSDTFMWHWNDEEFMKGVLMEGAIAIPTIQMAMKWLREKYNLHIITLPYAPFDRLSYHPGFEAEMVYIAQLFRGIIPIDEIGRSVIKLTPEEACEAAIKYCLENLI